MQTAWLKRRDHALAVGLFVGNGGLVEQVAVAPFTATQFAFAVPQEVRGVFDLAGQGGDFVCSGGKMLQRQSVGEAARVLFHALDSAHQSSRDQQMDEQSTERTQSAEHHDGPEELLPGEIAIHPGRGEQVVLLAAE